MDSNVASFFYLGELELRGVTGMETLADVESFGGHSLGLLLELKGLKACNN